MVEMRNTDEESEYWHLWARLPPLGMLLLLVLSSVVFATDISADGKTYEAVNLSVSRDYTDAKVSASSYRIYTDVQQKTAVMDFKVLNSINSKNVIQDCQQSPYYCDFKLEVTPSKGLAFSKDVFAGGWQSGEASVSKIFYYQNESYTYYEPTWALREVTDLNGTKYIEQYQDGTKQINTTRIIEQDDLSKLYSDAGKPVQIVIRFTRTEIRAVDIYPKVFGNEYKEWSIWGTGGTETTYINGSGVNITVHTFLANGTFTVNNSMNVSVLVIGGGGAGGLTKPSFYGAGAGGAGGLLYNSSIPLSVGSYSVVVGTGGINFTTGTSNTTLMNGSNSIFGNMTAYGGGHGQHNGTSDPAGQNGGSGGGGGNSAGGHVIGQGQDGSGNGGTGSAAGGGGGASGAGFLGSFTGGAGGDGTNYSISGVSTCYAGGGGGGAYDNGGQLGGTATCGGGAGGNGNGAPTAGADGVNGTGGGGGGGGYVMYGGKGGSGIVIISYATPSNASITISLISPTNSTVYFTPAQVPLVFNCSGDSNTAYSANITMNGSIIATGFACTNNASTTFTYNTSVAANYTWSVLAYNSSTSTNSTTRNFRVNQSTISISLSAPENGANYSTSTSSVTLQFNCSGGSNGNYLANLTVNGVVNATAIACVNNATTSYVLSTPTTGAYVWSVLAYNSTASQNSSTRTFNLVNTGPAITYLSMEDTPYQLGPVHANITAQDAEQTSLTVVYTWFKNGANTSAGSVVVANNTLTTIDAGASPYTVGDNWNILVQAYDSTNYSAAAVSANKTISDYFSGVSYSAPGGYSHIYMPSYLNLTLAGASSASAYFVFGSTNTTMTNSGSGANYIFTTTTAVPPSATANGTWYYKATLANGSSYETSSSVSIPVNNTVGFFYCNASINTTSIVYQFQDAVFHTPVNATFQGTYDWIGDDGVPATTALTNVSTNMTVCIAPSTFNRAATVSEITSATGYLASIVSVPLTNYSAGSMNKTILLINTSFGGYYTFIVSNQYNSPISGATVSITQGVTTTSYTTDITGSIYATLVQLNTYTINASASGYNSLSFPFVAGPTTTIPITLTSNGSNIILPNFSQVFTQDQYSLTPINTYIANNTTIIYTVFSNGTLTGFGMDIVYINNGTQTTVFSDQSTNASGGAFGLYVDQPGLYTVNIWFKDMNYANYTPVPTVYVLGGSGGLVAAKNTFSGNNVISGWAYYFILLVLAMLVGGFVSRYSMEGAVFCGWMLLFIGSYINPDAVVIALFSPTSGITTMGLTVLLGVLGAAVFYLKQYGS
jgi:hypothetical protein